MKENRVAIPSSMEPPIACMTHISVSAQRSNVQDALCISQSYKTTSLRLSKRAEIAKGKATRSPEFPNGRFQHHGRWKLCAWIWWTTRAGTPWLQSTSSLVSSPMISLTARQTKLLQKCGTTSPGSSDLPRKSTRTTALASDLANSGAFVISLTL